MYMMDFFAIGAIKRNVGTARAFRAMIESWNLVCARALLRMHIDTALRFSAAWLVQDPHSFASQLLGHERIDRMRDSNGRRMTDAYLVSVRSLDWRSPPVG